MVSRPRCSPTASSSTITCTSVKTAVLLAPLSPFQQATFDSKAKAEAEAKRMQKEAAKQQPAAEDKRKKEEKRKREEPLDFVKEHT